MQKKITQRNIETQSQIIPDLHPVLQRIYNARGITNTNQLNYQLANLLKPNFKGMDEAVQLLADAVVAQAKILIVADFDADGATSCALGVLALRAMGLNHIDFLVPNRFEYGYGLTPEIVEVAAAQQPDLLITVDNGISSIEGVNRARELGIAVIVTDHHLAGKEIPQADAIVNPNQPGCEFPSKSLAGVGVIFYVMNALRAELRNMGWFAESGIAEPNMANFLDLVALGTVADVVPLDHNNRVLVAQGVARIRAGKARPGINALIEIAGKSAHKISATDFGFALGPRLNAAGRLDDMSLGIQCLLCESENLAREIAIQLDELNRDRKLIETGMQQEAMQALQKLFFQKENGLQKESGSQDENKLPWGICLFDETWHQGVIGILASRIKDKYHRPTIVFADAGEGQIKGSARSIHGFHIRDALDAIATRDPNLLQKFGGHAMAAGLSLHRSQFELFNQAFDAEVKRQLTLADLDALILTDGQLPERDYNLNFAKLLRDSGPWGQHFPEPEFDNEFFLVQQKIVGEKHLKLQLAIDEKQTQVIDAIAFNIDTKLWPNNHAKKIRCAYKLDINEYRGQESLQLLIDYLEAV